MSTPVSREGSRRSLIPVNNNNGSPKNVTIKQGIQGEDFELVNLTVEPHVLIHTDPSPPPEDFNEESSQTQQIRPPNLMEEPPHHVGSDENPKEIPRNWLSNVIEDPDHVFIEINQPTLTKDLNEERNQTSNVIAASDYVVIDIDQLPHPGEGILLDDVKVKNINETGDELSVSETSTGLRIQGGEPLATPRGPILVTLQDVLTAFDAAIKAETTHWERRYLDDPNGDFRLKINSYIDSWIGAMEFKDAGLPEEDLDPLFQMLGSKLTDAYGMTDAATGDWSQEVKTVAGRAGAEYAKPSVEAFVWTQLPNFLKSLVDFYVSLYTDKETASTVKHVTTFVYPFVQIPTAIWAAQNNARKQSGAVQQHKRELSTSTPNPAIESSSITNVDGTPGELRPLVHIHEDLEELKEASELVKGADQGKLEDMSKKIAGQILLARGELQTQLAHVTAVMGAALKLKRSAPLSDKEEAVLNETLKLEDRVALLIKFTSGRAAVPGPQRQRAKRLLKQLKQWDMLQPELRTAIESVTSGGTPEVSDALHKAVVKMRFERMQVVRYRMLNVLSNQAIARDLRTAFFMGSTLTQLSGQVASYVTGNDDHSLLASSTFFLTLIQTIVYAVHYPKATGLDALNKLATQFQIIAMTGPGNFLITEEETDPKTGKKTIKRTVDTKKLDKVVQGPLKVRLDTIGLLLKFDQSVYKAAVVGWLLFGDKPQTLNNDDADTVKVVLPGTQEEKEIPCTYTALADEFGQLKTSEARKAFVDQVASQRPRAAENKGKIDRNLKLYEDNEYSLANARDMSALLGEGSKLPEETRVMFLRSLGFIVRGPKGRQIGTPKQLLAADRKLFEKAGNIERKSDKNFQTPQKLGQALAWLFAGTTGFLGLKSIMNLAVELAILRGELTQKAADALAADILAGKAIVNVVALASLIFALGLNHAYHDYIAQKALQRQDAAAGGGVSIVNAPEQTLRGGIWEEFLAMIGRPDAREEEITGYDTLVGTQLPKADWPPKVIFMRPTPIMEAMKAQMFVTDLTSWTAYFKEKHGELVGKTTADLDEDMKKYMEELRTLLKRAGVAESADATKKDADISQSDDDKRKIEVDAPLPKVPPIKLPAVATDVERVATPRSGRPGSPRNLRSEKRPHPLFTGVSQASVFERDRDPGEVVVEDEDRVPESEAVNVPSLAQRMRKLDWRDLGTGISVAQDGTLFYLSRNRDPSRHANPIEAFSVPGVNSEFLHMTGKFSTGDFPSLAVSNMLQADLDGNKHWNLTTDAEFAQFFRKHLHSPAKPEPKRLAEMRMQDLAAFTQQMALDDPEARWHPMTTATVHYKHGTERPVRFQESPPAALQPNQSFGVSCDGLDLFGKPLQSSVLLSFDQSTGLYSIIVPTLRQPIATKAKEPMDALQSFMKMVRAAPDTTFTLLYHVPPSSHEDEIEDIRQMVEDEKGNIENLAWAWIARIGHADKARGEIERVFQMFEAQNSYLLWAAHFEGQSPEQIAASVIANRITIDRLGRAYSHLATGNDPLST